MRPRQILVALSALLLVAMMLTPALAGEQETTLSNGAVLGVTVDDPVTSTEFLVPPGDTSIDVDFTGTAAVGLGEPGATWVYVVDVSGSTDFGSGTGCSPILGCEQEFITALNQEVINDGSSDEVGVVVYASSAATGDMEPGAGDQIITEPAADSYLATVVNSTYSDGSGGNGGVAQYTNKPVGQFTNYAAGVQQATNVVNASSNPFQTVVFLSDGIANRGAGSFASAVSTLAATGAVVHSVAVGTGSECNPSGTNPDGELWQIAANGGSCFEVPDPGNLPDIIENLTGSSLDKLEIAVDGGAATQIPNADITLPLPQEGPVEVGYTTTVAGLTPGDHEVCVTAYGSDVLGGAASVTVCETIHLLTLTLQPPEETNELGEDQAHVVTATVVGDPGYVGSNPRTVIFEVTGANPEGPAGTVTDGQGEAVFAYSVPLEPASLGMDTIRATTVIGGETTYVEVIKYWVDTTPPVADCLEGVNPHGKTKPEAPGQGGQGQNQDGFYELVAEDDVWPVDGLELYVLDTGSGTVFGPFDVGTVIKYTEDDEFAPELKKIGSGNGQADAVDAHIIGNGDAALLAIDGSGNTSDNAACLVPPPPK